MSQPKTFCERARELARRCTGYGAAIVHGRPWRHVAPESRGRRIPATAPIGRCARYRGSSP